MKVLIACEFSGRVRDAFILAGHQATSCDFLPTESQGPHYQGDVRDILDNGWDLMIAHPPCTYLCRSGARWWKERGRFELQSKAIDFVIELWYAKIPRICIENPIGILSTCFQKPTQIIQPWMFGHGETKATCLWLRGLPLLKSTDVVSGRYTAVHYAQPGIDRWKERSITHLGIAQAMANQWGK